jgi:hypothetical protein
MNCFALCLIVEKKCKTCGKQSGCTVYDCAQDAKLCIDKDQGACDKHAATIIKDLLKARKSRKALLRHANKNLQEEWERNYQLKLFTEKYGGFQEKTSTSEGKKP